MQKTEEAEEEAEADELPMAMQRQLLRSVAEAAVEVAAEAAAMCEQHRAMRCAPPRGSQWGRSLGGDRSPGTPRTSRRHHNGVQRWRNVKRYFQCRLVTGQAHTLANAIRTVLGFDAEDKVKCGEKQTAILRR